MKRDPKGVSALGALFFSTEYKSSNFLNNRKILNLVDYIAMKQISCSEINFLKFIILN